MSRATVVYLSMIGIGALGLWVVLELGDDQRAPIDLNGEWSLSRQDAATGSPLAQRLTIEQSGQFLRLSFDGTEFEDYRLIPARNGDPSVELHGPSGLLLIRKSNGDSLEVE